MCKQYAMSPAKKFELRYSVSFSLKVLAPGAPHNVVGQIVSFNGQVQRCRGKVVAFETVNPSASQKHVFQKKHRSFFQCC
eukprot:m.68218 g.68218  ORF g.68218 m.68218 type:complete len:80 (-) comp12191_c1_seq1:866-1105(-)